MPDNIDIVDVEKNRSSRQTKRDRSRYMKEYRSGQEGKMQRQIWLENHPDYYPDWRANNRERYNQQQRQWRSENREKLNEYMRNLMRKRRGSKLAQPENNSGS